MKQLSISDKVAVITSIAALLLSMWSLVRDSFLDQHVLRAAVVGIEEDSQKQTLRAKVLLLNGGKNYETLFSSQIHFVQYPNKDHRAGSVSDDDIGPVVLKPGEARVLEITATVPDVARMRKEGEMNPDADLEVGVFFCPVLPDGRVLDRAEKLYRVTVFHYAPDGKRTGSGPGPGFNDKLLDLF